jgi:hypothetical protein
MPDPVGAERPQAPAPGVISAREHERDRVHREPLHAVALACRDEEPARVSLAVSARLLDEEWPSAVEVGGCNGSGIGLEGDVKGLATSPRRKRMRARSKSRSSARRRRTPGFLAAVVLRIEPRTGFRGDLTGHGPLLSFEGRSLAHTLAARSFRAAAAREATRGAGQLVVGRTRGSQLPAVDSPSEPPEWSPSVTLRPACLRSTEQVRVMTELHRSSVQNGRRVKVTVVSSGAGQGALSWCLMPAFGLAWQSERQ